MRKFLKFLLITFIVLTLISCGGEKSDPMLGKYLVHTAVVYGQTMSATDLFDSEETFAVELTSDGKVAVTAEDEIVEGDYKLEGETLLMTFVEEGEEITMEGRLVDNMLYIDNVFNMGVNLNLYKEGTTPVETQVPSKAVAGAVEEDVSDVHPAMGGYYGYAYHENANENFSEAYFAEKMPIWGLVGQDPGGNTFFQIYTEQAMTDDSVLASMWVDLQDNRMVPIIGEEDAWIYDLYLNKADQSQLTTDVGEAKMVMHFEYREEDEGNNYDADITFYLIKLGSPWEKPEF